MGTNSFPSQQFLEDVDLDKPGDEAMGAWFLGIKGENEPLFSRLIGRVIEGHFRYRRKTFPLDPSWINSNSRPHRTQAFLIEKVLAEFMSWLETYSIPWFTHRYHAHMNWDTSLPAVVGYFAAMLHNQNNVAGEGSPITTQVEIEVARDLCKMIGYLPKPPNVAEGPWGHITCDGSVANIEALWAGRNLKLYPFAVAEALRDDPELRCFSSDMKVKPTGRRRSMRLVNLSGWQILNLDVDTALGLLPALENLGATEQQLAAIDRYTIQALGAAAFDRMFRAHHRKFANAVSELGCMAPASAHYSWPKGMALSGLGTANLVFVPIEPRTARMNVSALRDLLKERAKRGQPVSTVVAVIGSTQESAVDDLRKILSIREELRSSFGMDFYIHADAAWGGYFASVLRDPPRGSMSARILRAARKQGFDREIPDSDPRYGPALLSRQLHSVPNEQAADSAVGPEEEDRREFLTFTPEWPLKPYVRTQLEHLMFADSVTVDPHKSGYVPYPAGALCYRNRWMPEMIAFKAPVVYHDGDAPTVGVFGIEGSKPGAAPSAVWMSHRIIRPDQSGYGKVLMRTALSAKRMFGGLATIRSDLFVLETLQNVTGEAKRRLAPLNRMTNEQLFDELGESDDPNGLAAVFHESGPDLLINSFAVNFYEQAKNGGPGTVLNSDPERANRLNDAVYKRLSLDREGDELPGLFITGSTYERVVCGDEFVDDLAGRLQLTGTPPALNYLIATTANPWLTDADEGKKNMVPELMDVLNSAVEAEVRKIWQEDPVPNGRDRSTRAGN